MKIVIFAMLFSGGIITLFMVVSKLHLTNTIWSLVLPGAVPVFNVILLINFFKGVPDSLDDLYEQGRDVSTSDLYSAADGRSDTDNRCKPVKTACLHE